MPFKNSLRTWGLIPEIITIKIRHFFHFLTSQVYRFTSIGTKSLQPLRSNLFFMIHFQDYEKCGEEDVDETKITTADFIFPYNQTVTTSFEKRRQAASVLNQMLLVLETMVDDLDHRRQCLKGCTDGEN